MTARTDELSMISETVSRLFDETAAQPSGSFTQIGPRLTELGWSDIESEYPVEAAALLFTAQGRSLAQTECLDTAVRAELGGVLSEAVDAVVLPSIADAGLSSEADGEVRGIVVGPGDGTHGRLAIPVRHSDGRVSLRLADTASLSTTRLSTFDPSVHWTQVSGPLPEGAVDATAQWPRALAAAQRALATELIAIADAALAVAVEHVTVRVQYGTPIGAMQSPRHALADAAARLDGARSLLADSWRFGGSLAAATAKAAAGRAHRGVSDVALQVCGAIGLTEEHRLHRFVTRGFQLDALCGSAQQIETQLATALFDPADAGLPTVVEWA